MAPDQVKITLIATGFEHEQQREEPLQVVKTLSNESLQQAKRRVSGGYDSSEDILDIPTFLRKQMD